MNQRGIGLVEILVALLIGLIVLGAVWNVFLSSRQGYRTNDALARVQDNGRFAASLLSRELRLAGYKGLCGQDTPVNNLLDTTDPGYDAVLFNLDNALLGWDDTGPTASWAAGMNGYVAGTDVLLFKHAGVVPGVTADGNTPANANAISLTTESGIPAATIVVVSDVLGCDMFQNRSSANATNLARGAGGGTPGNVNPGGNDFSHAYDGDMEINTFRSGLYYVGAGNDGRPALRRMRFDAGSGNDELVADGVEDMQIVYGEDTNGDRRVERYCRADAIADWNAVVAVRVTLLVGNADAGVLSEQQVLEYDDGAADPDGACDPVEIAPDTTDLRLRQVFTTTVALRNRLP